MEFQAHPFNMNTVFIQAKKKQTKNKLRIPNSSLYTSIWPMIYVMRMFGLAPYKFSQDRLMSPNIYLIFSVIVAALYIYVFYKVALRTLAADIKRQDDSILGGTENIKLLINYSVAIYELGLAAFKRRSFTKTWNALQDYDKDVRQLGYPRKETQTTIAAWILTIVIASIWIAINRIGMYALSETWTYNMEYLLVYIGTSMALCKFVAMAFFLGQRFHHLNTMAIKSLPSISANKSTIITVSKTTILSLHNELMIAAENLESIYSWSLLFWLGNLEFHTVSDLYIIIVHILKKRDRVAWSMVCIGSVWLFAFLFQLLLLHIACHYSSFQANRTSLILVEWQVRQIKENKKSMDLQLLNRRFNFSAAGCFYVDLPLLCSIAALSTTYLVILLQFPI